MGKLNVTLLRYLDSDHFRVLTAVEMGMKNHELVPKDLVVAIATIRAGGTAKILKDLCKNRLLQYESSGTRYSGYRLTNAGYDYLALKALTSRGIIQSFGNQIGTGKESNIYVVANSDNEQLCLKLHRLGRTCFRRVREKRDYHKKRKQMSWIYLSRISCTKEFAYMKALYDRGFPVPKPIDFNRHCVVMELVEGHLLQNIAEVGDVEELYNRLMNLVLKFANYGVIHGDFNEFNIMVTDDGKPIIIDFPQMVSVQHVQAEYFFDRDVACLRDFFRRRFNYASDTFPAFADVVRVDAIDAEVSASGITRQMEKDLLKELGVDEESSEDDDGEEDEDDDGEAGDHDRNDGALPEQDEDAEEEAADVEVKSSSKLKEDVVRNSGEQEKSVPSLSLDEVERLRKDVEESLNLINKESFLTEVSDQDENPEANAEQDDDDLDEANSNRKFKPFRDQRVRGEEDDRRSCYTTSTMASIAPEVIRQRVKASIEKKKRYDVVKRIRAKGDSSAVNKSRQNNLAEVKASTEAFWDA